MIKVGFSELSTNLKVLVVLGWFWTVIWALYVLILIVMGVSSGV